MGALGYLRPEGRLPSAYQALPQGSSLRQEALQAARRSAAAQAFLGGVGGLLLLVAGAGLWELRRLAERLEF